jgi:Recombinase zinc beta ribbon domain
MESVLWRATLSRVISPVIDKQLFYRAQLDRSERKKSGAGRKGLAYSNLFSGLAKCAYCGSSLTFENKGAGKKGNTYLICDSARRRLGCNSRRWRYCDFEASFLAFVEEADLSSMLHGPGSAEREILRAELNAVRGQLASVVELMEKAWGVLEAGGPGDFVSSKLNELAERSDELKSLLQSKTQEYEDSLSREAQYLQSKEEIKALLNRLQGPPDSDLYSLRARVAGHLRSIVSVLSEIRLKNAGARSQVALSVVPNIEESLCCRRPALQSHPTYAVEPSAIVAAAGSQRRPRSRGPAHPFFCQLFLLAP